MSQQRKKRIPLHTGGEWGTPRPEASKWHSIEADCGFQIDPVSRRLLEIARDRFRRSFDQARGWPQRAAPPKRGKVIKHLKAIARLRPVTERILQDFGMFVAVGNAMFFAQQPGRNQIGVDDIESMLGKLHRLSRLADRSAAALQSQAKGPAAEWQDFIAACAFAYERCGAKSVGKGQGEPFLKFIRSLLPSIAGQRGVIHDDLDAIRDHVKRELLHYRNDEARWRATWERLEANGDGVALRR